MHFAVNDRGEAVLRIADDVLPDVQNRPARRVDERAALVHEPRHVAHRDAEGGKDHDVVRSQRLPAFSRIAEEPDVGGAQLIVDVRVVDDLAGQEDVPSGEAAARLIRVIDRAVHSVTESELAREVNRDAAGGVLVVVAAHAIDDGAVVGRRQLPGDGVLHVEAFAEDQRLGRRHVPT